jgi:hypothetical protein
MSGPSSQTSTVSNSPPPEYLAAYSDVLGKAQNVAATPYQQYPGQLQAAFSPMQNQGFDVIGSAPGVSAPYINAAAQDFANANTPLAPTMQPYVDQAQQQYQTAANSNLQGALTPWQQQAQQGFAGGSQALTPTQYSGDAIKGFENPYTQQVVDATQAQFNNQNMQAQNQLRGDAASKGALGGDRFGVAQGVLAGQQQSAQAPVIAGLENQGFAQAQQEFNNQQTTNLTAQQQSAALKQQAAQGFAGLGSQSMTAAQQQAALQAQAGQGFAGLGQSELGAAQAQGWLDAQSGAGMAGLGNQALSSTLSSGSALLGAGAQQQAQAQGALNIPYQQFVAQQSYPFQTTGWLSNIAQGLGSASGSTGVTTSPGPSGFSQAAGLGTSAIGALGQSGAFGGANGSSGWLSNAFSGSGNTAGNMGAEAAASAAQSLYQNRGGAVRGFAGGGGIPDVSAPPVAVGQAPGTQTILVDGLDTPDPSASVIPPGGGTGGVSSMKRNYGTTTTGEAAAQDSPIGTILKTIGTVVASFYGGPAGGAAASAAGSQIHFNRGGFAGARGGHAPVLPAGFAAGGSPAISVVSVPNAKGFAVPTMTVDPSVVGSGSAAGSGASGSPSAQLTAYLKQQAAGASHVAPTVFKPAAPVTPAPAVTLPVAFDPTTMGQGSDHGGGGGEADTGGGSEGSSGGESARRGGFFPRHHAANGGFMRGFATDGAVTTDAVTTDDSTPAPPYNPRMFDVEQFGVSPRQTDTSTAAAPPADATPQITKTAPDYDPEADEERADAARARSARQPPASDSALPAPPPPPPPPGQPSTPAPSGGFAGQASSTDLPLPRALREDHASPWLSMMRAGFGMMAGTSPHAMVNIGAGAAAGLDHFVSADKSAKDLAAKVYDAQTRLKETQAFHGATIAQRTYGIDTRAATAAANRDNAMAIAMARMAASADRSNAHVTGGDLMSAAIHSLDGEINDATGKPYTPMEKFKEANNSAERFAIAQGNLDERRRAGDQRDTTIENAELNRQQLAELRQQGLSDARARAILSTATNAMRADPTLKLPAAVAAAQKEAARLQTPPPAQDATTSDPLGIRQ